MQAKQSTWLGRNVGEVDALMLPLAPLGVGPL